MCEKPELEKKRELLPTDFKYKFHADNDDDDDGDDGCMFGSMGGC